jgi:hypothetical protein
VGAEKDKNAADGAQTQNLREREALNNAYGALIGQQSIQGWTAFTVEEALDAQIERIEGKSNSTKRPNELERVEKIEQETLAAIKALRETPAEQFRESDASQDVNTPRDGDDE